MRFGIVGASGTVINVIVLFLGKEYLFEPISNDILKLNIALAFAIFLATLNNFYWNKIWTWADRQPQKYKSVWIELIQYFMSSWVGIALQFILTPMLATVMHYLLANVASIVFTAVLNYFINDHWTFNLRKHFFRWGVKKED